MEKLSEAQIASRLASLDAWQRSGSAIERVWVFKDFLQAMQFINQVATAAEQANHHPDMNIVYNKVTLRLSTHDAGGLTDRDFTLAAELNKITF